MREEAFAEFHQVCYVVSQVMVLLLAAFSNSSGACCLKMQRGRARVVLII